MKLIALLPVRNEDWCLGLTLRALLMWVDSVVILLHACTDGSADIVEAVIREHDRGRVIVLRDSENTWREMTHRGLMLDTARSQSVGATHIVTLDADEILTGNCVAPFKPPAAQQIIEQMQPGSILQLPGYNLRNGLHQFHSNGIWGRRWFSCAFQDDPRLHWAGDRFHHREPMGLRLEAYKPILQGQGGILHLWGCSERRLKAKHALYKVVELLKGQKTREHIEAEYSLAIRGASNWWTPTTREAYGNPATWTYADVPAAWWEPYKPLLKHLDLDAVPWQESEVRRLIDQHGTERFAGLDLFGVC